MFFNRIINNTKKMIDRIQKSLTERIYLMESLPIIEENDKLLREYMVMGATGNLYKVTISNMPSCTCPDYRVRHKRCKHIFFILIRIMHCQNEKQEAYDDDELKQMFESIPEITRNLVALEEVQNSYQNLQSKEKPKEEKDKETIVEQRGIDDICPICLDDLKNTELDYCKYQCGKSIHKECFKMWCKKNNNKCVFCRGDWTKPIYPKKQYINLFNHTINN